MFPLFVSPKTAAGLTIKSELSLSSACHFKNNFSAASFVMPYSLNGAGSSSSLLSPASNG